MKRSTKSILAAAASILFVFAVVGCNDEIVPNKQLVDSMNKQRAAMSKNLPNNGGSNSHAMSPDQATGQAPAPNGSQR